MSKSLKSGKSKNILIIYPHWVPSNLAGVHRPRLIANFLPDFGWQPHLLTVKPEFYEEPPDPDMLKTASKKIIVYKTDAKPAPKHIRLIGDIALRSFKYLKREALKIIKEKKIDFIWIPIPAYYTAILGRVLYEKTKIPYGIDYIDPWVNGFVRYERIFSRAWLSNRAAKILEPYAVKKASLISGVATAYYQDVLDRNFKNRNIEHVGMPYGFDPNDHKIKITNVEYPWQKDDNCLPLVYAGAFLPQSHLFIRLLFKSIKALKTAQKWNDKIKLFFVGTGNYQGKTISSYAKDYNLEDTVIEINKRFPFLHILNILAEAYGVTVIGSTQQHYTASKIFQSLLSEKPVFAVFHHESTVVNILKETNADNYLVKYNPRKSERELENAIKQKFLQFIEQKTEWCPNLRILEKYSSKESARKLVEKLEIIH